MDRNGKSEVNVARLLELAVPQAVATLLEIMRDVKVKASVRMEAAQTLIDYDLARPDDEYLQ